MERWSADRLLESFTKPHGRGTLECFILYYLDDKDKETATLLVRRDSEPDNVMGYTVKVGRVLSFIATVAHSEGKAITRIDLEHKDEPGYKDHPEVVESFVIPLKFESRDSLTNDFIPLVESFIAGDEAQSERFASFREALSHTLPHDFSSDTPRN